jgi:hypothetical protein
MMKATFGIHAAIQGAISPTFAICEVSEVARMYARQSAKPMTRLIPRPFFIFFAESTAPMKVRMKAEKIAAYRLCSSVWKRRVLLAPRSF